LTYGALLTELKAGTLVKYSMLNARDKSGASLEEVLKTERHIADPELEVAGIAISADKIEEYLEIHMEQVGVWKCGSVWIHLGNNIWILRSYICRTFISFNLSFPLNMLSVFRYSPRSYHRVCCEMRCQPDSIS
jgi:hypothetical protein